MYKRQVISGDVSIITPKGILMSKDEIWKVINVDVEPRQKSFRIGITPETTVEEVIKTLVNKCKEENIELDKWAKAKVGQENAEFVLIRKSTEELIPPTVSFAELMPTIDDEEEFIIGVRAQVGTIGKCISSENCQS